MSRRSKVDLYGLLERVIELYEREGKSIYEIEQILRAEGYDISRESIRRRLKSWKELEGELKKVKEESQAFVEALAKDPANVDMAQACVAILTKHVLNALKNVDGFEFSDPVQMVKVATEIAKTQIHVSRFRVEQLEKVAKKVEKEGQKRNIDPEFLEMVKKEIYGLSG